MSAVSSMLEDAIRQLQALPPGSAADREMDRVLIRLARGIKRLPKPPQPDTPLNASAKRALERMGPRR